MLKAREGALAQTPFPLLLHAMLVEERSGTLELKLRNVEKRIAFEDGTPVGCSSNLLHETLGKYLVTRGKLTEVQYQTLLGESAATSRQLGSLLVEKQLVSAFELFKHLQTNLAHKVLDVFRWQDAKWRFTPTLEDLTPIRLAVPQLIFTGCAQLPPETLAAHFDLPPATRLALVPGDGTKGLKLAPKDARLVQVLKARPTLGELLATPGLDREAARRRLFALAVLQAVDTAEAVDALPPQEAPLLEAEVVVEAAAPQGLPFLDEDDAARNLLADAFLSHRQKDPYDLLGVPVSVQAPALQRAYLARAEALSPVRFATPDLKQKAESVAMAYARAYAGLADGEQNLLHRKRRETLEENRKNPPRANAAAAQFRIRTDLLDASSQFDEGRKRLAAGAYKSAVEHFEYACDIEPTPRIRAYLAWARYQLDPQAAATRSLQELAEACAAGPACEEAWAFRADLALAFSRHEEAEDAYRKAFKLNPQQRRYADGVRDATRAKGAR